jgi:hypothetical protein
MAHIYGQLHQEAYFDQLQHNEVVLSRAYHHAFDCIVIVDQREIFTTPL